MEVSDLSFAKIELERTVQGMEKDQESLLEELKQDFEAQLQDYLA